LGQAKPPQAHAPEIAAFIRAVRRRKLASIVSNETIALELDDFLRREFGARRGRALLDVGAGSRPYGELYEPYFATCTSTDVGYSPHDIGGVDVLAPADDLPFDDGEFDCVLCTEVLEHCRDPARVMAELGRVLRPGGALFLTTPFLVGLHEMPHDYYRYTPSAVLALAEDQGLAVEASMPRGDYLATLLASLQFPLAKVLSRLSRIVGGRLYTYSNPLVYVTLVLPQLAYMEFWHAARRAPGGLVARLHGKLSGHPLGYITIIRKPDHAGRRAG
jgi:SAM-dependent methyltransferase